MKPFNLELAKQGCPVCTRDGQKVRIVCFDVKSKDYPLLALVEIDGKEISLLLTKDGCFYADKEKDHRDLFIVSEKKEGWINLYKLADGNTVPSVGIYNTEEEAKLTVCGSSYITTIKIEWEE